MPSLPWGYSQDLALFCRVGVGLGVEGSTCLMGAADPPCHLADDRAQLSSYWGHVGRREVVSGATPQFHSESWGRASTPLFLACFLLWASRGRTWGES